MNRGLGDSWRCSQSTGAPVSAAIDRLALQGPVDHLSHLVVLVGAWPAGPELIVQAKRDPVCIGAIDLGKSYRKPDQDGYQVV